MYICLTFWFQSISNDIIIVTRDFISPVFKNQNRIFLGLNALVDHKAITFWSINEWCNQFTRLKLANNIISVKGYYTYTYHTLNHTNLWYPTYQNTHTYLCVCYAHMCVLIFLDYTTLTNYVNYHTNGPTNMTQCDLLHSPLWIYWFSCLCV